MQSSHAPIHGQKRPAEQLPGIDSIIQPLKRPSNDIKTLPPPYNILPPAENVLSTPPLLQRILSYVLTNEELTARNVVIRAREGVQVMYSDTKLDIMKVCRRWRYALTSPQQNDCILSPFYTPNNPH